MALTILKNTDIVLPDRLERGSSLVVEDGRIARIGGVLSEADADEIVDLAGAMLYPGFIDVHIHGAVGVDVNDADAGDLLKVAIFLAENGVTSWLPTLVPDSDENYRRAIDEIDRLMDIQPGKPVAQAVGVHYEGVFANQSMCGALRPEFFKSGQFAVGGWRLPRLASGVHMTTLAPEIDGGIALVETLVAGDWVVSIGHTRADVLTLDRAFAAGARHITHFFNAMTGVHHREIGVAGWGLTNKDVTFDIIADGIHVHPKMLEFACHAKTPDKVSLISDSVAPTGLGDGKFELWGETVTVENGRTRNERGSIAGSVSTMLDGVKMMKSLGFSEKAAAKMAASNPAKLIAVDHLTGSIEVGKSADLVALETDGNVRITMVKGQIVQK